MNHYFIYFSFLLTVLIYANIGFAQNTMINSCNNDEAFIPYTKSFIDSLIKDYKIYGKYGSESVRVFLYQDSILQRYIQNDLEIIIDYDNLIIVISTGVKLESKTNRIFPPYYPNYSYLLENSCVFIYSYYTNYNENDNHKKYFWRIVDKCEHSVYDTDNPDCFIYFIRNSKVVKRINNKFDIINYVNMYYINKNYIEIEIKDKKNY